MMSVSNFGSGVGSIWGGLFLKWWGINANDSTKPNEIDFTNLSSCLCVTTILCLLPILGLKLLPESLEEVEEKKYHSHSSLYENLFDDQSKETSLILDEGFEKSLNYSKD